jgi:hypothetical protein
MSRRRPPGELQFGSDSFLDVVANIVGILIILIVIAGLRVSQTPVFLTTSPDSSPVPVASSLPELPEEPEPLEEPLKTPQVIVLAPAEEPEEEEPEPPPAPLPELVAPPELVRRAGRLESEISTLKHDQELLVKRSKNTAVQQATLLERQRALQNMLSEQSQELDASRLQVAKSEADLELLRQTIERLKKQLSDQQSKAKNVHSLEHRVTPISRVVNGVEKHYRLEKNRIVEVPLDELIHRFREQFERRKEWIVKTRQQQGEIGPVQGFTMRYSLRFDALSGLEAARFGMEGYTLRVTRWEIRPEPDLKGETEDVALRKGSKFYQSILGTAPDTTLTFWVYPDSYSIYRKVRKFAHDHGYSVAGRPLPHGLHIAGSPDGSKSAAE